VCGTVLLAGAAPCAAQAPTVNSELYRQIEQYIRDKVANPDTATINLQEILAAAIGARRAAAAVLAAAEDRRTDEQIGAGSRQSGTTTLIAKPSVPSLLSLAVENGALARETSGTTITFRGNAGGIIQALQKHGFTAIAGAEADPIYKGLGRLSGSVSFDTSRGAQPAGDSTEGSEPPRQPEFTADKRQVSAWSLRAQLVNTKKRSGDVFWTRILDKIPLTDADEAANRAVTEALLRDEKVAEWVGQFNAALRGFRLSRPVDDAARTRLVERLQGLVVDLLARIPEPAPDPTAPTVAEKLAMLATDTDTAKQQLAVLNAAERIDAIAQRLNALVETDETLQNEPNVGVIVTAEYLVDRPVTGPSLGTARLIVSRDFAASSYTFNAGTTFFPADMPTSARRAYDVHAGIQVDLPLGSATSVGTVILSFSGKYQRLLQDALDGLGGLSGGTKGNIVYGQARVTIPTGATGVRVPLSVTYSNRTELITDEKQVRGHVGVSYDLDALFARLKP